MRILCGDPGLKADSFGIAGINADTRNGQIYPKYAREFKRTPFGVVAATMAPIIERIRPDFVGLETNNQGPEALEAFRAAGINARGITTTGRLSPKKRIKWQSMDKTYTVQWIRSLQKRGRITWPKDPSPGMRTLEIQILNYKERREYHGGYRYEAGRGHDDVVMAFILACHMARIYMERADWN